MTISVGSKDHQRISFLTIWYVTKRNNAHQENWAFVCIIISSLNTFQTFKYSVGKRLNHNWLSSPTFSWLDFFPDYHRKFSPSFLLSWIFSVHTFSSDVSFSAVDYWPIVRFFCTKFRHLLLRQRHLKDRDLSAAA